MTRLAILLILASVGAGFLAVHAYVARFEHMARGGALIPVVIATRDLAEGEMVQADDFGVREMPERFVESRHVRADQLGSVLGVRLTSTVLSNEVLLWNDVSSPLIGPRSLAQYLQDGMRALTLQGQTDGLLTPGDRVDIQHTAIFQGQRQTTRILVQNAIVIAAGTQIGPLPPRADENSVAYRGIGVTVSVLPQQAAFLVMADRTGEISFLARNPSDPDRLDDADSVGVEDLPGLQAPSSTPGFRPAVPAPTSMLPVDFSQR